MTLEFTQAQDADVRLAFDTPREKRTASQRRALVELMLAGDPALHAEYAKLSKLRATLPQFVTTLVVRERTGRPRETFVHLGGDFTRKGARVEPAVPAVLPGLRNSGPGAHPDRRDLARWLVERAEPADGARAGESDLASLFWAGARRDGQRFRDSGHAADASGIARLAGVRAR